MTQTTLTALYDSHDDANAAAERLVTEANLSRSNITINTQSSGQSTATADEGGFFASLKNLLVPDTDRNTYAEAMRRGGYLLTAQVEQASADQAMDILEEHGAVDLEDRQQSWGMDSAQPTGAATMTDGTVVTAAPAPSPVPAAPVAAAARDASGAEDGRIELAEETLRVGKRAVDGGRVRVRSYVVTTPVEESVSLREEHVAIERRPADRAATASDEALFTDRVIEASETSEEAVVAKDMRVTGEVVLRKEVDDHVETVRDTVRRTDVEVDDTRAADAKGSTTPLGGVDPAPRR